MSKPKYTSITQDNISNNNYGDCEAEAAVEVDGGWTSDLSEWMTNLPQPLHCTPLNKLAIPGSHDSGGYWYDTDLPIAPDESSIIKKLGKLGKCVKHVVYRWARTQKFNLTQQLENGVRYLDMRSAYLASEDDFFFVHGLYGPKVTDLLQQVKIFLDAHPKEVVILDFNHNYFGDADPVADRFGKMIESILADKMYPVYSSTEEEIQGVLTVSLHDIWKFNKQVLALCDLDVTCKGRSNFWPSKYIFSPWFDTDDDTTLVKDLNAHFDNCKDSALNVFQAILSPQTMTIVWNFFKSLEEVLADKADRAVRAWLSSVYDSKRFGTNIVICDFVGKNDIPRCILRLNDIRVEKKCALELL